ncbi:hypothetical protein AGMMS49975_02180 [Clostridia bacterium]|nr:hypothetical protein AGMMS49975_02180 [Clostridia bacterium]
MEFFKSEEFLVLALFLYSALMFFCANKLAKSEKRFFRECIHTTGTVVSYKRDRPRNNGAKPPLVPVVSVFVNNETITSSAWARRMNETNCPVGSCVKILYNKRKTIAGDIQTIRVDEDAFRSKDMQIGVVVFRVIGAVMLVVTFIVIRVYFG